MLGKLIQVIELVEMGIHLIPVHPKILVGEHIPKSGQRGQSVSKLRREDAEFALLLNRLVVVLWLRCVLKRNDAVANVDAALRGYFKVALGKVPKIWILLEVTSCLFLKRA